ncbi:MAG: hypothetical protein GC150_07825 [Rhizobiales bacterium]|nr:hypothetical protein [Hyphomicrobiales bacterium]
MKRIHGLMRVIVAGFLSCVPLAIAPAIASPARTADDGENCHSMLVIRVIDGDTVHGYIDTSDPLVAIRANLRLERVDAPERGRRASCEQERERGEAARAYVARLLDGAIEKRSRKLVRACDLRRDKYALRRVGRLEVRLENGWVDVGALLLKRGLVRESEAGGRRSTWCA